ncbi:hypothetical protein [Nonomuraea helvata]|uniref:XRE family transcriptional regulator n=1 Tax=Nonomuraea helvata TaxID=37484 RepID=A0ABV5S757_9ACTN
MTAADMAQLTRWFPLVDRPRPTYPPLTERVAEVRTLARDVEDAADPLLGAARALNRAALIASDCGLPELARELCWRQIAPYRNAGHLTVRQAMHMLEPVVNLARLRIRAGDAETAWASLSTLYHALKTNTHAVIEGRSLPTQDLTGSPEEHQELRIWAYRVYLSEGTRALVRLDRWQEALAHVEQNKGIGLHLLDGRQVKIVNSCLDGNADAALAVLDGSTITQPWETQVSACLEVLCRLVDNPHADREAALMIERYLAGSPEPGHAVFRARLGLAVVDLTTCAAPARVHPAYTRLVEDALDSADGYVAREVLAHDGCRSFLDHVDEKALTSAAESAGLGIGSIPDQLMADLLAAVERSETAIERVLDTPTRVASEHAPT